MTNLLKALESILNVKSIQNKSEIIIKNENQFQAKIIFEEINNYSFIKSPFDEKCLKIDFELDHFLIVTPNDFVFNTINGKTMKLSNLPAMISINEMLQFIENYIEYPEPNNNMDNTIALYLFNKLLLISAQNKNFMVDDLLLKIKAAALSTTIGEEVIESEKYL